MESAAREGGARVLDARTLLARRDPHGIPGWETFFDNVHPVRGALDTLAHALLQASDAGVDCMTRSSSVSLSGADEPANGASTFDRVSKEMHLENQQNREFLAGVDATNTFSMRLLVDQAIQNLLRTAPGESQSVLERFDREIASEFRPTTHGWLLDAVGEICRNSGRLDLAQWAAERSIAVSPGPRAFLDRALLKLRAGQGSAAQADVEQAGRVAPSDAEARQYKALWPLGMAGRESSPAPLR
jgi:hypothetical protein